MRRLRPIEKRREGEFRLLRLGRFHTPTREAWLELTSAINFARFMKHVQRLKYRLRNDLALRRIKIKTRRVRRAERAAARG